MSSKPKPNVITPFDDKQRFKNLVLEVIKDTTYLLMYLILFH